jgi:hypothetical protein
MHNYTLTEEMGNCVDPQLSQAELDLFFSDDVRDQEEAAREFCTGCPIAQGCLRLGLETAQRNRNVAMGVWGGKVQSVLEDAISTRVRIEYTCPWCGTDSDSAMVTTGEVDGRWPSKRIDCSGCGFWFHSTNAANRIEAQRA